ncbi:hypothetical protein ACFSUS_23250 [Spirosoma soli]|uniref:DUF5018 domain-containing protein n=1 Tax=Spirosoma soli TaxID=1770529 RepID=A0ABW5M973_9BACT
MKTIRINTVCLLFLLSFILTQCTKEDATPVTPKSSAKSLDTPAIEGLTGASSTFDATTNSYTMTVPGGTDITAIKFTFALPTGATAKPASGSTQNFTKPVTYTVTAEDGSAQAFTVNVVYKSAWVTSQDRYDAIRIKAQRVSGVALSSAIPAFAAFATGAVVTDADAAYIINTADFVRSYEDSQYIVWQSLDKTKLEYYSVGLTKASGAVEVRKGTNLTLDKNGNFASYKPGWYLGYSK